MFRIIPLTLTLVLVGFNKFAAGMTFLIDTPPSSVLGYPHNNTTRQ